MSEELNPKQREAAEFKEGIASIIAKVRPAVS